MKKKSRNAEENMEKSIIQDQKLKKNKMHTTENAIEKINKRIDF